MKLGDFDLVCLKLRQALIAFAILGSNQYIDFILLQLGLWEYQKLMHHPSIDIIRASVGSFVGEDIELFNRLLSQHSKSNSRRADPELLNTAYQSLGSIVHAGIDFNTDLLDNKLFLKGNRRYTVDMDGEVVETMRTFLKELYDDFLSGEFLHYEIPYKAKCRRVGGRWVKVKADVMDHRTLTYKSKNTGTLEEEAPKSVLYSVKLLTSLNWMSLLSKKFQGLLARNWQFQERLKPETLEKLREVLPQYVGADRPQRRKTTKRKARAE